MQEDLSILSGTGACFNRPFSGTPMFFFVRLSDAFFLLSVLRARLTLVSLSWVLPLSLTLLFLPLPLSIPLYVMVSVGCGGGGAFCLSGAGCLSAI